MREHRDMFTREEAAPSLPCRRCSRRTRQSIGDVPEDRRVERQAEVRADDLDIDVRLPAQTVPPIHHPVALRVHGSLPDRTWQRPPQGPPEGATATTRSTIPRVVWTRVPDPTARSVAKCQYQAVQHEPPERRAEGDDRSDSFRPPYRRGSCEDTAEAMSDEMHPAACLRVRTVNGLAEAPREAVGTIAGKAHTGIIWPVPDSLEPRVEFEEVKIHPE